MNDPLRSKRYRGVPAHEKFPKIEHVLTHKQLSVTLDSAPGGQVAFTGSGQAPAFSQSALISFSPLHKELFIYIFKYATSTLEKI